MSTSELELLESVLELELVESALEASLEVVSDGGGGGGPGGPACAKTFLSSAAWSLVSVPWLTWLSISESIFVFMSVEPDVPVEAPDELVAELPLRVESMLSRAESRAVASVDEMLPAETSFCTTLLSRASGD